MLGLEFVVVVGAVILLVGAIARRLQIAPPILLLITGALLGFIPVFREVQLPSEVVLLLFLPALLFWEALNTSSRGIRTNLRGIVLLSTVLVVLNAGAVAVVAHALGLHWGAAWVLGAALAPTDATAVGVFARMLPRRNLTVLRAESLVNDGTALVIYALAVAISTGTGRATPLSVTGLLLVSYLGGAAAGVAVAWLAARVRRLLPDPVLESVAIALTPFGAFLLAETVHASGVLAAVAAGLITNQFGPRIGSPQVRQQTQGFWTLGTFLLNAALFVLVGLQAQTAVRGLSSTSLLFAVVAVVVIAGLLFVVRLGFLILSAYTIRLIDRRPQQRLRRMSNRARVVSAVSGLRGAVSLAAALAVPQTLADGSPFPGRDFIVFVTAGVIALTLIVQGLALPATVRWARLPVDTSAAKERADAELTVSREALQSIASVGTDLEVDATAIDRVREEYEEQVHLLEQDATTEQEHRAAGETRQYLELSKALVRRKRARVIALRDQGTIDDVVMRDLINDLDLEEVRLSRRVSN